jgi:anti-sigma B factor antagonist
MIRSRVMENVNFTEGLAFDISEQDRVKTIKCSGHIDSDNSILLSEIVNGIFKSGFFKIVIDLSAVKYISSAGWGIFLGNLRKATRGGGDIHLAGMQQSVKEVYKLLELNNLMLEFKTVQEASYFN